MRSLGIDVEPVFSPRILDATAAVVFRQGEMSLIGAARDPARIATICFSAKEAFYKCLHPITRRFFDFDEGRGPVARQRDRKPP
ncbi:MAG: 4'-phosphopantetheinyl transferase superfamily protein, partial [Sphingomonas sp.]